MRPSDVLSVPFGWLAALRHHRRAFHPDGALLSGTLTRTTPDGLGLPVVSGPVVARVSKAIGVPGAHPDVAGLAWRMFTASGRHGEGEGAWDVLLASAARGPVGRIVPLPVRAWNDALFSSIAPFDYRGSAWWVRARIVTPIPLPGLSVESIVERVRAGAIQVDVEQARGAGAYGPLARLDLDEVTPPGDVSFDPVRHEAPGVSLKPAWLTSLRRSAYRRSRAGRDAR